MGISELGEKKTLRITAEFADEWNVWATPEILQHKNSVLDGWCEKLERDHRYSDAMQAMTVAFPDDLDKEILREMDLDFGMQIENFPNRDELDERDNLFGRVG